MSEYVTYRRSHVRIALAVMAAAAVVVAVLTTAAVLNSTEADTVAAQLGSATERGDAAVGQAKALGQTIAGSDVCQSPDAEVQAQFGWVCQQARKVVAQAEPDPVDTDALASAVAAMVLADLPARIDAAVAEALRRTPPSVDADTVVAVVTPIVQAAVTSHLLANPPAPGRAPTAEEIATATRAEVAAYFERNPPPTGPPGETGPGPTPEQIDAAVAAWFAENPVNACPGEWVEHLHPDGEYGWRCLDE